MTGSMAIPPIKQTKINTQAIIDAGQSLLIGGYYFEQKSNSQTGVPLLMDVPLLGALFRSTNATTKQMERLLLITPRVVRLGATPALPPQITRADFERAPEQGHFAPPPPPVPPPPETDGDDGGVDGGVDGGDDGGGDGAGEPR
jgi:type III secretion protein C